MIPLKFAIAAQVDRVRDLRLATKLVPNDPDIRRAFVKSKNALHAILDRSTLFPTEMKYNG